jgi:putative peptidoglycan lipid II flippase
LSIFGKLAIQILFQHGAFTKHSSALTALALIGYALGLPGNIASLILLRSFYALKNAVIPLLISIFALAAHVGLLVFLMKTLTGKYVILSIPLAAGFTGTAEACLLGLLLLWYLRMGIKKELENSKNPASPTLNPSPAVENSEFEQQDEAD